MNRMCKLAVTLLLLGGLSACQGPGLKSAPTQVHLHSDGTGIYKVEVADGPGTAPI